MSESGSLENDLDAYLKELGVDLDKQPPAPPDDNGEQFGGDEEELPRLYFGSVDEFVREMIVPVFKRRVGDRSPFRWAADWWRYPEALLRLESLWRAWENLRLDPATGMSVWLRDHADYHLNVLMSDYGPFGKSMDSSELGDPLPYTAPPPGMFPDVRDT